MQGKIIDSGVLSPELIMKKDADLLASLSADSGPILHLYEWSRTCLTYGYFTNISKELRTDQLEKLGVGFARRPTGGGVIFHQSDFAFSLLVPSTHFQFSHNTLENYRFVQEDIQTIIYELTSHQVHAELYKPDTTWDASKNFCMVRPTQFDLVVDNRKIAGAAQRRTQKGFLHQGSIALADTDEELLKSALLNIDLISQMRRNTFRLLDYFPHLDLFSMRQLIKEKFIDFFSAK